LRVFFYSFDGSIFSFRVVATLFVRGDDDGDARVSSIIFILQISTTDSDLRTPPSLFIALATWALSLALQLDVVSKC